MRMTDRRLWGALAFLLAAGAQAGTVAVTEFLNNVNGDEDTNEWLELYNYGANPVDLSGWTISDNTESFALGAVILAPGEFLIVAQDPGAFADNWPTVSVTVVGPWDPIGNLANGDDEIFVRDAAGAIVWNLGYANDETGGRATFLAVDDFSVTDYGSEADPLIVRAGLDLAGIDNLGYESNDATADPFAFSAVDGDFGSPGAGGYSTIPLPAGLPLLLAALLTLTTRKRCQTRFFG